MLNPVMLDWLVFMTITTIIMVGTVCGVFMLSYLQKAKQQRRLAHSITIEIQDSGSYQVVEQ